ncbi:hypothetical protein [Candidatus Spongiisocius sp.]|uniref:hypothetical protein n=1 Tax=Candidatus Spongiisocius sp. TaxID=3101273 RepID=UPI003B5C076F
MLNPAGQAFRVSLGGRSLARSDQPVPPDVRPAPYSDQQLLDEYLSTWAAFAFGCDTSEVSDLQVLPWVAGYDNTT